MFATVIVPSVCSSEDIFTWQTDHCAFIFCVRGSGWDFFAPLAGEVVLEKQSILRLHAVLVGVLGSSVGRSVNGRARKIEVDRI